MYFAPPEFQFHLHQPLSCLILNAEQGLYPTTVHCIIQARSQNEVRNEWVRGDTGFSPECASRNAGREVGALGTELTWAG